MDILASVDVDLLRTVVLTHPISDGYNYGSHMVNLMRGTELLSGVTQTLLCFCVVGARQSPAVAFVVGYIMCFLGTLCRQILLGQPWVIVETADQWLLILFAMWLVSRTSQWKAFYNIKLVKGIFLSMGAFTRVRKTWVAVGATSKLYPNSPAAIFVVAFAQAIGTAWGWAIVQRLTSTATVGQSKQSSGPSPVTDWRGFTVISSILCAAGLTLSRSDERIQVSVAAALTLWFLVDTWIRLFASSPTGGTGTKPESHPGKDAKKKDQETKKNK